MTRVARARTSEQKGVGTAEFRAHLAKYLRQAKSGRPVVIQERGRDAYLLTRLTCDDLPDIFGCMKARTDYTPGVVLNLDEDWTPGKLP